MNKNGTIWSRLLILYFLLNTFSLIGQSQTHSKLDAFGEELNLSLSKYFTGYHLQQQKITKSQTTNGEAQLSLEFSPSLSEEIILTPEYLLSENHRVNNTKPENWDKTLIAQPYVGCVVDDPSSVVRITMGENFIYGYIETKGERFFVEPVATFHKSSDKNTFIVYTEDQIKKSVNKTCAVVQLQKEKERLQGVDKSNDCNIVELAIATDFGYYSAHDGTTGAINQSIAVMNMVAGDYDHSFANEIRFEIVEHFIVNCNGCDPWTSSVDANQLLTDFTSWGPTGFTSNHDLGQLWTSRDICGDGNCSVAGLAWIDEVCGEFRYHLLEDFSGTAWQLRVLSSHEIGHNFGSYHDTGGTHIMAPSITTNTSTWSTQSINAINTVLSGYACLESCVLGSCTEILSLSTSNCTPDSPSLYDLTVEIRHGGGGSSSSFDILVNGQSHNFAWNTSPQVVHVTGLIADGTTQNTVSIRADDGTDSGCFGSGEYDEPAGTCSLSVSEDFNDCAIPPGWTTTTTNNIIWNGGDPRLQYEWKFDDETRQFANYDDHSNATSLKTIDGSCMALMDDDIISSSAYTGEVMLISPEYDMSDYDTVIMSFDYNFHPFEDGGKGNNNSFFEVEVFDGSNWQSVLYDTDSTCPWHNVWQMSCTSYINMDITAYANEELRVRFTYNDGNDGRWTGMIALDNFELTGVVAEPEDPCEEQVSIMNATISGTIEASQRVVITDPANVVGTTHVSTPELEIMSDFAVPLSIELTIVNDGCDN